MSTESKKLESLGYGLKSSLVRDHEFNSDHMADWNCELTGPNGKTVSVEYHTGKGHRTLRGKKLGFRPCLADWKNSKPTNPDLAELVHCLLLDSSASDQSFSDWCGNYGYDTDSRKALDTYLACQKAGHDLRSIGANISELQTILEDY